MKRRDILAGVSFATAGFAGCLGSQNEGGAKESDRTYEQCDKTFVRVDLLPDPAKEEAVAAIEDGVYETDSEPTLPQVVRLKSYSPTYLLRRDDNGSVYYDISVETDGDVTRIRANNTLPEAGSVSIRNDRESDLELDIRIEHEGELLVEDTAELSSGVSTTVRGNLDYRYGSYRAEIGIQDGEEYTEEVVSWDVSVNLTQARIIITPDITYREQGEGRYVHCEWNDEGDLVSQ